MAMSISTIYQNSSLFLECCNTTTTQAMISHNYLTPQFFFFFYKNMNSHSLATYGFKTFPSEARALELG